MNLSCNHPRGFLHTPLGLIACECAKKALNLNDAHVEVYQAKQKEVWDVIYREQRDEEIRQQMRGHWVGDGGFMGRYWDY